MTTTTPVIQTRADLISALEERQFLRRLPNRARALEILKIPELGGAPKAPVADNVVQMRTAAQP